MTQGHAPNHGCVADEVVSGQAIILAFSGGIMSRFPIPHPLVIFATRLTTMVASSKHSCRKRDTGGGLLRQPHFTGVQSVGGKVTNDGQIQYGGFANIGEGSGYSGTTTAKLQLKTLSSSYGG